MKKPIKTVNDTDFIKELMGLGKGSAQKSYYPQLQMKIKEISELHDALECIINSMPSIIIAVNNNLVVTQWNVMAECFTNIKTTDALSKFIGEVLPEDYLDLSIIQECIDFQKTIECPKQKNVRCGQNILTEVVVSPIVGAKGAVIRIDDVTERNILEEIMVQNEKMMSVGGLAAGMAHEINNPLAGIMQTAQLLMRRLKADNEKNRSSAKRAGVSIEQIWTYLDERNILEQLNNINDSGARIAKLVDNMLSFARKNDTEFGKYNIIDIIERTIDLFVNNYSLNKNYDYRQIKFDCQYEQNLPSINCEMSKLQQVFFNLFTNGAQAMYTKDYINDRMYEPKFVIRVTLQEENICIEVEDNGPGISLSDQKRIFEPFFTTKPVGVGTGLGLSVSFFIVNKVHLGSLTVRSELGKGTVFVITLPIKQKHT